MDNNIIDNISHSRKKIKRNVTDTNNNVTKRLEATTNTHKNLIASVILPVYNKEQFLPKCIECLDRQTMDKSCFEAIFIDDSSTDKSLQVLHEMQETRSWVHVLSLEHNSGVQVARNLGIDTANGRYIFFLDPDDVFSPNTLADVSSFFDEHAGEVDLVTYPIEAFTNGKKDEPHARYKILTKSGIYDLSNWENRLVCQTTMNICIANRADTTKHFNFKAPNGKVVHEDQFFIANILREKMSIGYCANAVYRWEKRASGTTLSLTKPYYIWDNTITAYENLFESFKEDVPVYFQAMLAHDLAWKMKCNAALPVHLHGARREAAMQRLSRLLDHVEDRVLIEQPNMYIYHALYFANLKNDIPIKAELKDGILVLMRSSKVIRNSFDTNMIISKTRFKDDKLLVWGYLKSPAFCCTSQGIPQLFMQMANTFDNITPNKNEKNKSNIKELSLKRSVWGRTRCKSEVAAFYDFHFSIDSEKETAVKFFVKFDEFLLPLKLESWELFSNFHKKCAYTFKRNRKFFTLHSEEAQITVSRKRKLPKYPTEPKIHAKRLLVQELTHALHIKKQQVWLYNDSLERLDNAWIQFCHDALINDGVRRYYIANGVSVSIDSAWKHATIIKYGSSQHTLLFYIADKIIASDTAIPCWTPLKNEADSYYRGLFHAELIYLQHGVLWAHLPWLYSKNRMRFDRVVISTSFEKQNLVKNYDFNSSDLIPSGMPRYSQINLNKKCNKRILFCPSWRQYLIGKLNSNGIRQSYDSVFLESDYYKEIRSLLKSHSLRCVLKKQNWTLDFKLHPNFSCYAHYFEDINTDCVKFVHTANPEDYMLAITDYSSFSFDFLYLNRALIYFIPDYELFRGGVNHYNKLDIPLNDAFGEFTTTADDAICAIKNIIENDGKPLTRYAQKTNTLFLHRDNNQCDRLYEALISS